MPFVEYVMKEFTKKKKNRELKSKIKCYAGSTRNECKQGKQHAIFSQTFNSVKLVLGIFNFRNGSVKAKSLIPQGN